VAELPAAIDSAAGQGLRESHPVVVAAGTYIMDVLGRPISDLPVGQTSRLLDEIRPTPAGTAGGTAVDLARLGAQVRAIGAIGDDLAGDFVVGSLRRAGVDTAGLRRTADAQTSCTILPIHPDGSRPAWHVPGANSLFSLADVDWDAIEAADAVHLGGLTALPAIDGEPAGELLARARAHGAMTTIDFLGIRGDALPALTPVLPHVDIAMPNEAEALQIAGDPDCVTAARRLRDLGARCVIVKRGADGCLIVDDEGERTVPGFDVVVVDTTGCGDAFCAGVIVARLAGWETDAAAGLGCATGSLNVRALGSDAGARSVDEALAFWADTPARRPRGPAEDPTLGVTRTATEAP
jgi:sugar/nucleoside kinase (ribokinase family)